MRDVILTLVLVGLLPLSLKRPFVGALMFAIIGLANPHRFTWGFAYSMPWAQAYAGVTILGMLFTNERMLGDSIKRYFPVLLYLAWMGVTTIFAMEKADAAHRLVEVAKVHLMCLVTLALLTDWARVKQLVWVVVCSIGFFGLKGGIFTIANGGDFLVWGPPESAIQDNNHLAVGLVVTLPMMYWLFTQAQRKWLRALIAFSALMTVVSVFGSHSRSAFLGIAAMSVFLLLKSQHKFAVGAVGVIVAVALASFMPAEYWGRMETIRTYKEDASAMGRINVWHTAVNVANDRITGAGFEYYGPRAFNRYAPNPEDIHSAHSIYFQSLGEHGWLGLAMFLFIWLYVWSRCRRVIRKADTADDGASMALLARMIQVSLIGFAVGGGFVNIGNWDMMYYLAIAALGAARVADAREASLKSLRVAPPRYRPGKHSTPAFSRRETAKRATATSSRSPSPALEVRPPIPSRSLRMADDVDPGVLRKEVPADRYDELYRGAGAGRSYDAYDRQYWDSHYYPLYRAALSEVVRLNGSSVLEVGCGSGSFAHLLLQRSSIAYHGFDFSAEAIRRAGQRTGRPELFSIARAEADTVNQRPYDTIVCLEVLEHIERDVDVVANWPAGKRCVCSVPNFDQADHVRFFRHEDQVHERYGRYIELQEVRRIPRALIRGRGWREYLRQLRWSRNDPHRLLGMLGYKTFENLAGWLVFSGIRRDAKPS